LLTFLARRGLDGCLDGPAMSIKRAPPNLLWTDRHYFGFRRRTSLLRSQAAWRMLDYFARAHAAMAEINITQAEADALIAMEKHRVGDKQWLFAAPGERLSIPLISPDKREHFLLDVNRAQIKLTKAAFQNRVRQAIILLRLDLDGPPHRNPDDVELPCPHLHIYREGYGDKWAVPAPADRYTDVRDLFATFEAFMTHCNITKKPIIQKGLFT
jgi:hypothetical protein